LLRIQKAEPNTSSQAHYTGGYETQNAELLLRKGLSRKRNLNHVLV